MTQKRSTGSQRFITECKHAPEHLGRVAVMGLGKSGQAAAEYLAKRLGGRVDELYVAGGADTPQAREFAAKLERIAQERGQEAMVVFDDETFPHRFDLCIASPGISQFCDFHLNAQAACDEVISEIEFAWRESAAASTWVSVTGTNGKTTTTALAASVLQACGFDARAVGNIGDAAIAAVADEQPPAVYVVEVSSYQLAGTRLFAPDASIILNITPDHLSWHRGFENYVEAKYKAIENVAPQPEGTVILDATDPLLNGKIAELVARGAQAPVCIPLGTESGLGESMRARGAAANAAFVDEGVLRVDLAGGEYRLCAVDDLQIKGEHNVANALAAAAAALTLGARPDELARALEAFEPIVHRIEPCGSVRGVACYNDSKATNVDAVLKAVKAFPAGSIVLLLGGRDKGTDLDPLVDAAAETSKAVVCFGEARERFLAAFRAARDAEPSPLPDGFAIIEARTMEDALDAGLACARKGDTVLLSPACASFDEFSCYEERGDVFRRLVHERIAAAADGNAQAGEGGAADAPAPHAAD